MTTVGNSGGSLQMDFDWENVNDALRELHTTELVTYGPLTKLFKNIVLKVNEHSGMIKSFKNFEQTLSDSQKETMQKQLEKETKEQREKEEQRLLKEKKQKQEQIEKEEREQKEAEEKKKWESEKADILKQLDDLKQLKDELASLKESISKNAKDSKALKDQLNDISARQDEIKSKQDDLDSRQDDIERAQSDQKSNHKDTVNEQKEQAPPPRKSSAGTDKKTSEDLKRVEKQLKDLENQKNELQKQVKDLNNTVENLSKNFDDEKKNKRSTTPQEKQKTVKPTTPEVPKQRVSTTSKRVKDIEVVTTQGESKTVTLYKAENGENNNTIQTVILSLPETGHLEQHKDKDSKSSSRVSSADKNRRGGTPQSARVSISPAAVVDSEHRIDYVPNSDEKSSGAVVAPFTYNVFDLQDDVDRAHIAKIRGTLISKCNQIEQQIKQLGDKEGADVQELKQANKDLQNQIAVINAKFANADKLRGDKPSNSIDKEGETVVERSDGKSVRIFLPPKPKEKEKRIETDSKDDQVFADSLNSLMGRVEEAESSISDLNVKNSVIDARDKKRDAKEHEAEEKASRMEKEISDLKQKIQELQKQLDTNQKDVDDAKTVAKKAAAAVDKVADLQADQNQKIEDHTNTLNDVQNQLEDLASRGPSEVLHIHDNEAASERTSTPPKQEDNSALMETINKIRNDLRAKADKDTVNKNTKNIDNLTNELKSIRDEINKKVNTEEAATIVQIKELEESIVKKADRKELAGMLDKINSIETSPAARPFTPPESKGSAEPSGNNNNNVNPNNNANLPEITEGEVLKRIKETLNNHSQQLKQLYKMKADKVDVFKDLSEKSEAIDRLDQVKADANIVARKAEREYVDNVLDKLKRDLLDMVNNTNANTSDLFAKDLEYLKGLIDDKTDRAELKQLQNAFSKSGELDKSDSEGLAGKAPFRCLSCNRTMNGMRQKPQSMNFDSLMDHLPNPKNRLYPRKALINDPVSQIRQQAISGSPSSKKSPAAIRQSVSSKGQDDNFLPQL